MSSLIRLLAVTGIVWAMASPAVAMQIVAPTAGATLTPGAPVVVRVAADPAEQLTHVAVTMGADTVIATPLSAGTMFEATLVVPQPAVGPAFIIAVGSRASGRAAMDFIAVTVDPGPLRSLSITAPSALRRIGDVFQVKVEGLFHDSVRRDLTLPERGTTYSTSNDTVLGVHSSGLIQARRRGAAELTVTNRGSTSTTVVYVTAPDPPDNLIPVPDPGPDRTVTSESIVTLSAAASRDPDGSPLKYRWRQESGRIVTLTVTNAVDLRFIAPRVAAPQELTFSLVVGDDRGATSFPAVVRVTVQP
jgi:hypothetical protein